MTKCDIFSACLIAYLGCAVYATKVVIVGGGVSGLAAAQHLCHNGICDITILEAEDRVGGRLYTDRFEGEIVERGAEYMHGIKGNPAYWLLSQNFPVSMDNRNANGSIHLSSGNPADGEARRLLLDAEELYDNLNEQLMAMDNPNSAKNTVLIEEAKILWAKKLKSRNTTLKDAVTDAIFHYTMIQWSMEDGERAQNVSVLAYLYYRYLEGGDAFVPQGLSVLLELLQKDVPEDAVILEAEVTKINWDSLEVDGNAPGKVDVEYITSDGSKIEIDADHVIVTVSIGVLQKHHRSMFVPNLSKRQSKAVEKIGFGIVNRIFLHYEEKFWNEQDFPYRFLWDSNIEKDIKEDAHWFREISEVEIYKGSILLIWANAYVSREVFDLPDKEIGRRITLLLRKFMGNDSIPFPSDLLLTRWHKNDHFLGSYSYFALGQTPATQRIASSPLRVNGIPKVLFAGEATHVGRYSTVDGAYRSGRREARRIINVAAKESATNRAD